MHLQIPVGPNRNGPFQLMYQPKFPEFWVEWKAPTELLETIIGTIGDGFFNFSIMARSQSW